MVDQRGLVQDGPYDAGSAAGLTAESGDLRPVSDGSVSAVNGVAAGMIGHFHQATAAIPGLPAPDQVPVPAGLSNLPSTEVFVGRSSELAELSQAMRDGSGVVAQAVSGLGGIGKTSLAAAYARQSADDYVGIWWLSADSAQAGAAGLADLTRRLWPPAAMHPRVEVLTQWALSWVGQHPGMLLIWDNVEDVEDVRELIAALPRSAHLITSRRTVGWHRIGVTKPLRLGPMTSDDAVDLLGTVTDTGDSAAADTVSLCRELGNLPLAVEQAGAYMAEAGITAAEYLAAWHDAQASISWTSETSRNDRIMTAVWRTTLDRLADTPLAARVLGVMAWLDPEHIPTAWLVDAVGDRTGVREALRRLNAYSMINLRSDGTAEVHRVVQAVTRTPDAEDRRRRPEDIVAAQQAAAEILAAHLPAELPLNVDLSLQWRTLHPHLEAFATYSVGRSIPSAASNVMDCAFAFWRSQGNRAAAVRIAACSLAAKEQHHGLDHPDTLSSQNNLAGAFESAGDLGRAIPLFEATLADRERVLGPDHPDTLTSQNNLAGAYESAGDLGRAIPLYEATLAESERVLGTDHTNTLMMRNNLASAYLSAGDLGRAIPLYEATLAVSERVLGPDHTYTLMMRNNLASAYQSAGDLARAFPLLEATLAESERVLGKDHPNTLSSRNNLAGAYLSAGDLARAIPLFEATLAESERVLGKDHPNTLTSRNNLAGAYESAGDLERANPLFEATLVDRERVLGPDHPDTLASRNNLAGAHHSAGDLGQAIPLLIATLVDREWVLGPDHPDTLASRNNLAAAYQSAGDPGRVIQLAEATLAESELLLGPEHPITEVMRRNLEMLIQRTSSQG